MTGTANELREVLARGLRGFSANATSSKDPSRLHHRTRRSPVLVGLALCERSDVHHQYPGEHGAPTSLGQFAARWPRAADRRGVNSTGFVSSAEFFNPTNATWTPANPLSTPRQAHSGTFLPNGRILIAGGFNFSAGGPLDSAELYDPAGGVTPAGTMNCRRTGHTATLLTNGTVLVVGGTYDTSSHATNSVDLYNPTNGNWTSASPMSVARTAHTATLPVAEASLATVEDSVANLARTTYQRGNASAHTAVDGSEIRKLKRYVDALLAELLEIT